MPFTESQPINIHQLIIEEPVLYRAEKQIPFDPDPFEFFGFNYDRSLQMNEKESLPYRKIVFGNNANISEDTIEKYKKETARYQGKKLGVENAGATELFLIGQKLHLTSDSIEKLKKEKSWVENDIKNSTIDLENMMDTYNLEWKLNQVVSTCILVDGEKPTEDFMNYAANCIKEMDKRESLYPAYLSTLYRLRLIGYKHELTAIDSERIKEWFVQINEEPNQRIRASEVLAFKAQLMVINAHEIVIGDNGIEIIDQPTTNLNTTPPIPEVKNF